jgi:hypothetical protein
VRVKLDAKVLNNRPQRIGDVAILASSKAMLPHGDATAKDFVAIIEFGDAIAVLGTDEAFQYGPALRVEIGGSGCRASISLKRAHVTTP